MLKALCVTIGLLSAPAMAFAAEYPAPKQGTWTAPAFKFHTGEVMDLRLHYTTIGDPKGTPVLVLHGTGGAGENMLTPVFASALFGPGQPLDAAKHYIILPDAIGHGRSAKPSDGLKAKFPQYDYADMVDAQYRLVTEGLGVRHLRLVIGNSMGGMHAWMWGVRYSGFMDALAPLASQPMAMSGRNWMLRRALIETIRADPGYNNGNYTTQPLALKTAQLMFGLATSGGTLNLQKQAPTSAAGDKIVEARMAAQSNADANDTIWAFLAAAGYDPSPGLDKIEAAVLAINSADDERNPGETGTAAAVARVKRGALYVIPASAETSGHGTTGDARRYADHLAKLLADAPKLTPSPARK